MRQKQAEIDAMDERGVLVASSLWETTWAAKPKDGYGSEFTPRKTNMEPKN